VRSTSLRKIGSILALCALLLTVFAPIVSQLRIRDSVDLAAQAICSATSAVPGSPSQDKSSGAMHGGDACGYCSFAAHFPALAALTVTPMPRPPVAAMPPLLRPASVLKAVLTHWAQPRAPPVLSL
jgi:hypothetical protein